VPEYIKKLVEEERLKKEKKQQEEDEVRNRIQLRVYYENTDFLVSTKRSNTLIGLLKILWDKLELRIENFIVTNDNNLLSNADNETNLNDGSILNEGEIKLSFGEINSIQNDNSNNDNNDENSSIKNHMKINNEYELQQPTSLLKNLNNLSVVDNLNNDQTTTTGSTSSSSATTAKTSIIPNDPNSPLYFLNFIRLRNFVQHNRTPTDAFDVEKNGYSTLQELSLAEYKTYFLEIRSNRNEDWEVYYLDGLSIFLEEFDFFWYLMILSITMPKLSIFAIPPRKHSSLRGKRHCVLPTACHL
jgi:hypothetical protein